jgi:hypothetical protein
VIHIPFAYVGPGAGFAFLGSFLALLVSALASLMSLLLWPFRMLWGLISRGRGGVRRAIFLRLEGVNAGCIEKSFPGLTRLSVRPHAEPFWAALASHKIECTVLNMPGSYPPQPFAGRMLCGPGTPDAFGNEGSFSWFTRRAIRRTLDGGKRSPLIEADGVLHGELSSIPFQIRQPDTDPQLEIQGWAYALQPGIQTPWIRLKFDTTHAIVRFLATRTGDDFELYVTPIQLDPEHASHPFSHPAWYAIYLAKLLGPFWTLGRTGDDAALRAGVIDEQQFLAQVKSIHAEREAIFINALQHLDRGLLACSFDLQHGPEAATQLIQAVHATSAASIEPATDTAVLVAIGDTLLSNRQFDPHVSDLTSAMKVLFGIPLA